MIAKAKPRLLHSVLLPVYSALLILNVSKLHEIWSHNNKPVKSELDQTNSSRDMSSTIIQTHRQTFLALWLVDWSRLINELQLLSIQKEVHIQKCFRNNTLKYRRFVSEGQNIQINQCSFNQALSISASEDSTHTHNSLHLLSLTAVQALAKVCLLAVSPDDTTIVNTLHPNTVCTSLTSTA